MTASHPNVAAVEEVLAAAGVPGRVHILPEPAPTARAAAAQLGCPVAAIANSLVFVAGNQPLLIMTSGAHRVDPEVVEAAIGVPIARAAADWVRAQTGQPIGGVAPVGHPRPIRTLIDRALAGHETLWAAGGVPHAVFPIGYADLVRLTGGEELDVT